MKTLVFASHTDSISLTSNSGLDPALGSCPSSPIRSRLARTFLPWRMSSMASMSAARGGASPSGNHLEAFDHFLVVDFEATCEKDTRIYLQEIIEFPSVLVDGATGRMESAFRGYVRPKHHPVLTQFCRDLTGIRQEDVDGGVDLEDALWLHDAWLKAATVGTGARAKKGSGLAVVTWGDWDCRTMLESECRFKGIAKPPYFNRWINLRVPFEATLGGGGRTNLQEAVWPAGLEWEGRLHYELDDARNTARLLVELMRRGAKIGITGSLAPPPLTQEQQHKPRLSPCGITGSPLSTPPIQQQPHTSPCTGAATCFCFCYCGEGIIAVSGPMQGGASSGATTGRRRWESSTPTLSGAIEPAMPLMRFQTQLRWVASVYCTRC
uniref:Uncharacterized protein n=1 Tax=Avena sativa TaxID=4498 RepID=A0ACD5V176_AVESA